MTKTFDRLKDDLTSFTGYAKENDLTDVVNDLPSPAGVTLNKLSSSVTLHVLIVRSTFVFRPSLVHI